MAKTDHIDAALELADLLRPTWPTTLAALHESGVPLCVDPDPEPDPEPTPDPDPDPDPEPDPEAKKPENWKAHARRHEREAKKEREARKKLEDELKVQKDKEKSESQKALEKAKAEGRQEAEVENLKHRRQDRLESKITQLATSGVTVETGEGDDAKSEQYKFADATDALVYIRGSLVSKDLDEKDLFEDGTANVNDEVLTERLAELLSKKPHLRADAGKKKVAAAANDAGKGKGGAKSLEDMTPEEHLKRIQGRDQ